ncbi:MAG TPA: FimV/HubP family polar landmark protein [Gallionellaceae bacterium]|nr:FimV/HubP family polar landmark protein [Gallionellaceae bacterium]
MLKTLLKAVGLLACVVWFNLASAANMGGINVTSALGHPLKAEISLADMGSSDTSTLVARLASVNEFKNAGLDYPYSLPKLTFVIETRANGETYIKLTSTQPVNEPFVSLLVELSWPSGKMLREFTFLLDPAGFVPEQPKVAEVKPVEPVLPVQEPVPAVIPIPVPAVAQEAAALPVESAPVTALPVEESSKEELAESKPAMSDMAKAELAAPELPKAEPLPVEPVKAEPVKTEPLAPAQQAAAAAKSVLVEKGDTLGKLADEVKPVDVSLERMLVAMYRANAKSFDGKNMNRIKAGKILRMPEADEISKVSQVAAVKEIRAQVADWQNYRQQLAAAQSAQAEQAPKQEAVGKISAAVAEKTPVIKESAKEVLKLSKGESLGDKTVVGGGAKSKQEKLADKEDDTAAKKKQLQEEQKKIAKLEGINKDVSKLVELKGGVVAAASAPAAVTARKALPAASAVPATQPESADFDILAMLDDYFGFLLDDPVLLGAGVAVLLGLGGLGFVMARRGKAGQKKSSSKTEDVGATTGSWRTPVAPSPDTGDFTQTFAPAPAPAAPMSVAAALDDVDPISEADLFLNFGRDAQAEEILKDALSKNPSNNQVKLKLLSIYTSRKDSKTFSRYAQEVKDSGDAAAWERVAVMGREIDPENPTYGGTKGEVRHREPTKPEVDFDLGMDKPAAPADSNAFAAKDFKMDFDLTGSQPAISEDSIDLNVPFAQSSGAAPAKPADVDATSILSKEVVKSAQASSPMDFDVSGILPGEAKQIAQSTAMDFDISGILPEETKKSAEPSTMDFDLSGSSYESTAVLQEPLVDNEPSPSALNFNDLVFEIPTSQSKPVDETPKAAADEGMAFTIDFPTSENEEAPSAKPAPKLDMDFADININFGDDLPPANAGGEGKDEQWHEVATKLDLAKAYQEMGDADGAREILEEVMRDGDATQRESAEKLLQQIAA